MAAKRLLALLTLLALAGAVPVTAASRKAALKLLHQLEQVDGAGSGLDADTVRGMTPDQLRASVTPSTDAATLNGKTAAQIEAATINAIAAGIAAVIQSAYVATDQVTLQDRTCACVHPACNAGDVRLSCGGGLIPDNIVGAITEISPLADPRTCEACGCDDAGFPVTLLGTEICLRL